MRCNITQYTYTAGYFDGKQMKKWDKREAARNTSWTKESWIKCFSTKNFDFSCTVFSVCLYTNSWHTKQICLRAINWKHIPLKQQQRQKVRNIDKKNIETKMNLMWMSVFVFCCSKINVLAILLRLVGFWYTHDNSHLRLFVLDPSGLAITMNWYCKNQMPRHLNYTIINDNLL